MQATTVPPAAVRIAEPATYQRAIGMTRWRGPNLGAPGPSRARSRRTTARWPAPRLQQLEHPLVGRPGLAGQRPGHGVLHVVVADRHGVDVTQRGQRHLGHGPGPMPGTAGEAGAGVGERQRRRGLSSRSASRAARTIVSARRRSTPNRWYHHDGCSASRSGAGGSRRRAGPGAGSPSVQHSRCQDRVASPDRDPLAQHGGHQGVEHRRPRPSVSPGMAVPAPRVTTG